MTTLAYCDGVMASDSGAWHGDCCHSFAEKLAVGADGSLYGILGNAAEGQKFLDWVKAGCIGEMPLPRKIGEDDTSFAVLIARPNDAGVRYLTVSGEERHQCPYFAVGAGAPTAYGALFCGASAIQAIEAAKEHGSNTHGQVRSIAFPKGDE